MNYKILMYVTILLIILNLVTQYFTSFWASTNYSDSINSVLGVLLLLFGTQVFAKKDKRS